MLLLAVYAVSLWYVAMKWRREWRGVAVVLLGIGALGLAIATILRLDLLTRGSIGVQGGLLHLLIPYSAVVALISLFIVAMPKAPPSERHCRRCHYDLTGLDPWGLTCPECATPFRPERCPSCRRTIGSLPRGVLLCPHCGIPWHEPPFDDSPSTPQQPPGDAQQQHEHGHPADEHPADHRKL